MDYDIGGGVRIERCDRLWRLSVIRDNNSGWLTPAIRRALLAALMEIEAQDTKLTEDEHAY